MTIISALKRAFVLLISLSALLVILSSQAQDITPTDTSHEAMEVIETVTHLAPAEASAEPRVTDEASAPPVEITAEATRELDHPADQIPQPSASPSASLLFVTLPMPYSTSFASGYPAALSPKTGWIEVAVNGGTALQSQTNAQPIVYTAATFGDAAVEARVLLNTGEAQVLLRGYSVGLFPNGLITLYRDQVAVASGSTSLTAGVWTTLRLQIIGGAVQASVNGTVAINYTAGPLPTGQAGFAARSGAMLRVDHFAIYGVPLTTLPQLDATTTPPSTPTPTLTAQPSWTPSSTWTLTPQNTFTPTQTPFRCDKLVATDVDFSGYNTIFVRVKNDNLQDATYLRSTIVWNPSRIEATSPDAYLGFVSLENQVNWVGYQNEADVSPIYTDNMVMGDSFFTDDPSDAQDIYTPGVYRTIPAVGSSKLQFTFIGLTKPLYQAQSLWELGQTRIVIQNPQGGECDIPLTGPAIATPSPTPLGTITATPECADLRYTVAFKEFMINGDVHLELKNLSTTETGYLVGFSIQWAGAKAVVGSSLKFARLTVNGRNASDVPSPTNPMGQGMLVWESASASTGGTTTSPTASMYGAAEWLQMDPIALMPGSVMPVYLDFFGIGADSLADRGVSPAAFNNSTLRVTCDPDGSDGSGPTTTPGGEATVEGLTTPTIDAVTRQAQTQAALTATALLTTRTFTPTMTFTASGTPNLAATQTAVAQTSTAAAYAYTLTYQAATFLPMTQTAFAALTKTATPSATPTRTNPTPTTSLTPEPVTPSFTPSLTPSATMSPLAAPRLNTPADLSVVNNTPQLTWFAVPGAVGGYGVQIDDEPTFATPLGSVGTGPLSTMFSSMQAQGVYWWRVRAVGGIGVFSAWSEPRMVFVNYSISPSAGSVIQASANGTANVTFTWTNLFTQDIKYHLEVDDDETFSSLNAQVTTLQASHTLNALPAGVYYWRVQIETIPGHIVPYVGGATLATRFTIAAAAPRAVTPLSPANGALLKPDERPSVLLSWGWGSAGEPAGVPFTYDVEVDTSTAFNTDRLMALSGLPDLVIATQPLDAGTYYWRVRAMNAQSIPGPWSTPRSFIIDDQPPAQPVILTPAEASFVTTGRPTFTWTAAAGATRYALDITLSCGSDPIYRIDTLTGTSYTLPASVSALPQWTYQVCITAYDASGNGTMSEPRTFIVALALTPAHNAFVPVTTKPTFTWTAAPGKTGETVRYVVRIFSFDGTSMLYESPALLTNTHTLPTTTSLPAGLYLWQVVRSVDGVEDFPPYRSFAVGALSTGPTLLTPVANGVIGAETNFTWDAATAPAGIGITDYEFQVSRSASFTPTVYQNVTSATETSYVPDANQNRVTYYWRVRGLWNYVPVTTWSTRAVIVDTVAPASPIISVPLNNALLNTLRPTITWTAVPGATSYTVTVLDSVSNTALLTQTTTALSLVPSANLPQTRLTILVEARDGLNASAPAAANVITRLGTAPAQNAFVTTPRPTFTWSAVIGATGYTLQIDDDPYFDRLDLGGDGSVVREVPLGAVITHTLAQDLPAGRVYYWRVLPSNGDYPTDAGSRSFSLTTAASMKPTGLFAAYETYDSPPVTLFNNNIQIIAVAWTPPAIPAPYYQVEVGTSSTFPTVGTLIQPRVDTPHDFVYANLLTDGTKYWRVRGIYSADGTSFGPWSDVKTFVLDRQSPLPPLITAPANNVVLSTVRPTFKWAASLGAISYRIDMLNDTTQEAVPDLSGVTTAATTYTVPLSSMPLNQDNVFGYRWAVHASDAAGNMGVGDMIRRFYVFSGLTPTRNQLLADTTPTFTWTGVSGTGAGQWTLEVARDANMNDLAFSSPLLPATATSYTIPNTFALSSDVYYWRVYREAENTSTIQGQPFYIGAASSITPQALTPAANAWLNAEQIANGPIFTWDHQRPGSPTTEALVDTYTFEIATTTSFAANTIVYTTDTDWSGTVQLGGLPLANGTYYWRVRGWYGSLLGPASAPRALRIDQTLPGRPSLTAPVSSALVLVRTPTFTWTAVTGAPLQYVLEIDNDSDFNSLQYSLPLGASVLSYKLSAAQALPNGIYYWRVRAVDAAGNAETSYARLLTIAAP